ncbi:MAG: N-acetyltransferase [Clostridiales bacterium]|nr:N-acetyltransferase [Clostridiales bacterium]
MLEIVEATASDLDDVLAVERLAFGQEDEADLVRELIGDPTAHPLLSLLARDGGHTVGHILFTAARIENGAHNISASMLAPLAVVPEAQRQGVGGRLIERGVELLANSGVALVFVAGHPEYYPRHGFVPAYPHGLPAPYLVSPEEAWMVRALTPHALGLVRGRVVCAEAMDRPEYWVE